MRRRDFFKNSTLTTLGLGISLHSFSHSSFYDPSGLPQKTPDNNNGLINLSSNENPHEIPPLAKQAIIDAIPFSNRYSFNLPQFKEARKTIAQYYGVGPENILLTSGSAIVLDYTVRYFYKPGANLVTAEPTFFVLPRTAADLGYSLKKIPVDQNRQIDLAGMLNSIDSNTQLIYLVNPNNPTGVALKPGPIKDFLREAAKKSVTLIDEAYLDFLSAPDNESMIPLAAADPNIMVTRTFSKIHGMAGLRIGFVISHADRIRQLEKNYFGESQVAISDLSLAAALASLKDEDHRASVKKKIIAAREYTIQSLKNLNIDAIPSVTNFILFPLGKYEGNFAEFMLTKGIYLRSNTYLGEKFCRVSVGTMEEMQQFIKVMKENWKST
jgi:histidinol-phosphate aminotransferase